jgi:hypothetical protein
MKFNFDQTLYVTYYRQEEVRTHIRLIKHDQEYLI